MVKRIARPLALVLAALLAAHVPVLALAGQASARVPNANATPIRSAR